VRWEIWETLRKAKQAKTANIEIRIRVMQVVFIETSACPTLGRALQGYRGAAAKPAGMTSALCLIGQYVKRIWCCGLCAYNAHDFTELDWGSLHNQSKLISEFLVGSFFDSQCRECHACARKYGSSRNSHSTGHEDKVSRELL
jgi:hypothetical protein